MRKRSESVSGGYRARICSLSVGTNTDLAVSVPCDVTALCQNVATFLYAP